METSPHPTSPLAEHAPARCPLCPGRRPLPPGDDALHHLAAAHSPRQLALEVLRAHATLRLLETALTRCPPPLGTEQQLLRIHDDADLHAYGPPR